MIVDWIDALPDWDIVSKKIPKFNRWNRVTIKENKNWLKNQERTIDWKTSEEKRINKSDTMLEMRESKIEREIHDFLFVFLQLNQYRLQATIHIQKKQI
mgnify:CR=1 FL=1